MVEIEVKKSKFLSSAHKVYSVTEAEKIIKETKEKHKKATHVCYAYRTKNKEKANDAGEPRGTAGLPILNVITKQKKDDVLVVVVRYFGGIKLGAGGLIRAYTKAASNSLSVFDK